MARRRQRSSLLETATSRRALEARGKSYRHKIDKALWLLYRRLKLSAGVWSVEASDGHGKPWIKRFATADDREPSDGMRILSFFEAIETAKKLARGGGGDQPITIFGAIDEYAPDLKTRGALGNVSRLRFHLPPTLGNRPIGLVGARDYAKWKQAKLASGLKPATVRRTAKVLAAALNHAVRLNPALAVHRDSWRVGLGGIEDVHNPRDAILSDNEVRHLIAAAYTISDALGDYVRVHAETGSRSSQLAALRVCDLQDGANPRLLVPRSKKGRSRKAGERAAVPVSVELAARSKAASAGRPISEPLLLRASNRRWQPAKGDHSREFRRVVKAAGLSASVTIYHLRHSAIARMLLAATPLRLVAALVDSSAAQIEAVYARYIAGHGDELARRSLRSLEGAADGEAKSTDAQAARRLE